MGMPEKPRLQRRRLLRGLLATAITILGILCASSAETGDRPGLVFEAKSINALLGASASVDAALGHASSPVIRERLVGLLHVPNFEGVDRKAPLRVYVFMPDVGTAPEVTGSARGPGVVSAVPVLSRGKPYLRALTDTFKERKKLPDGLLHLQGSMLQGTPAAPELFVAVGKDKVFAGTDADGVRFLSEQFSSGQSDAHLLQVPGTVTLTIHGVNCVPFLEEVFEQQVAMLRQARANAPSPTPMDPSGMLEAQHGAVLGILGQIKAFGLGLAARERSLDVYTRLAPVAGTETAKFVRDFRQPSEGYFSSVPADSLLSVVTGGMALFDHMAEPYGEFVETLYRGMPAPMNEMGPLIRETIAEMKGLYTGRLALAVVPNPHGKGVGLVELISVNDAARARQVFDRTMERYREAYARILPGFTMETTGVRTYKGAEITSYRYDLSVQSVMPGLEAPPPPPLMSLFKGFRWEIAFVGNDMIYTAGDPAVMDAAIDRLKEGGVDVTLTPPFSSLMPLPKAKPVEVRGMRLVRLLKQALAALPGANTQLLGTIPDDSGGLAGYTLRLKGGELYTLTRISYSEIIALQKSVPALGGMLGQMMMSGMAEAQIPAPGSADIGCINNLRIIDAAKEQYALEKGLADGDAIAEPGALEVYLPGGALPTCPAGGKYSINAVGKPPTCSVPNHALEARVSPASGRRDTGEPPEASVPEKVEGGPVGGVDDADHATPPR
jgi:hypothetical protein